MTSYASPTISQAKRMVYSSPVQGPVSSMQHRYVSGQATHTLPSAQYTNYANYTTSGGPKYHPLDTKQVAQFSYSISPLYNPVHVPTFESTLQVRVDEGRLLNVWKDQIEATRVYVSEELSEST
ncbi:MAG: hypothetical protein KVP17_003049 [Porospora cf. gigantea B]|uniref:uncharacterized protein n=2 Tax=Porospora cf. gigantea B TaxID=2853592 RepID=UPI0035718D3A|nr:MAG: hypothetical protein KVP17_003049 [Porospora cf. gigantea B]